MTTIALIALACVVGGLAVVCLALALGYEQNDVLLQSFREGLCEAERKIAAIEARIADLEDDA